MPRSLTAFPRGAAVGAVLMFLLDPRRGRARRSRLLDQLTHLRCKASRLFGSAAADARHRVHGAVERVKAPMAEDVSDEVLEARVRSQLGRVVTNVAPLEVVVRDGTVELRGPILEHELDDALARTRAVRGVREVIDQLERHATADIPSLQGGSSPHPPVAWPPATQGVAVLAGLALVGSGLARGGIGGVVRMVVGGGLALRGAVNQPMAQIARRAIGREALVLEKSIHVHAPIDRVWSMWRDLQTFPRFMDHVREIELDDRDPMLSHWVVDGPAGRPLAFDAIITHLEQPYEIGWTTPSGQTIEHTGVVRFFSTPDGTRVQLHMSYRAPAGLVGNALARLLGWDPKARIDDDLIRMKGLLEDGHTRAHGERINARDLVH